MSSWNATSLDGGAASELALVAHKWTTSAFDPRSAEAQRHCLEKFATKVCPADLLIFFLGSS